MKLLRVLLVLSMIAPCAGCPRSDSTPVTPPENSIVSDDGGNDSSSGGAANQNDTTTGHENSGSEKTGGTTGGPKSTADQQTRLLLGEMGSGDPKTIKAASDKLAALHEDRGLTIYHKHLDDADASVRRGALWGTLFGKQTGFDPKDPLMADAVGVALADKDAGVRHVALEAINSLDRGDPWFVDSTKRIAVFVDDAQEPEPQTRVLAARMLGKHRTLSQPALPALNEAVKNDPEYDVRAACLYAIYNIARNADEALPAPMYVLKHDDDPRLRRLAARRLGSYKAASAPAIPALVAALADEGVPDRDSTNPEALPEEPVCIAASEALGRIGTPAVPALIEALDSDKRYVRILAARALGQVGPLAKDAAVPLERLATSSDPQEAATAKAALLEINGP